MQSLSYAHGGAAGGSPCSGEGREFDIRIKEMHAHMRDTELEQEEELREREETLKKREEEILACE
jgi:hypothetical protein